MIGSGIFLPNADQAAINRCGVLKFFGCIERVAQLFHAAEHVRVILRQAALEQHQSKQEKRFSFGELSLLEFRLGLAQRLV